MSSELAIESGVDNGIESTTEQRAKFVSYSMKYARLGTNRDVKIEATALVAQTGRTEMKAGYAHLALQPSQF